MPMTGSIARPLRALALGLLLTAVAPAQGGRKQDWKTDPFTQGDPAAMAAAGYVSFGPLVWAEDHNTLDIEHVLGDNVKLLWVETAHFRIGSSLPPYKIPAGNRDERTKLRRELERLRRKLPAVKTSVRKLNRWLRLHLYAMRLEDIYADFERRMGVTDDDFPPKGGGPVGNKYMGEGPYLGQPEKYTVLLFEKKSSCGHYLRNFLHTDSAEAVRYNFVEMGSLLYVTSTEFGDGTLANDTAMHCEATFNTIHTLVDGYRYFNHSIPHWFRQGLAHWYLRRVSPKYNVFYEYARFDSRPKMLWDWAPRVRARVKFEQFPPAAELIRWRPEDEKTLVDSMMVWSRVDYLMSLGDERAARYIDLMNGRIPMKGHQPTRDEILDYQKTAMTAAWGLDPETFDRHWAKWVLETYPAK